jgi:hypothetical protein
MEHRAYRRFLILVVCVVTVGLGSLWAWAGIGRMWYMDPEYPIWLYKIQTAAGHCFGNTTVIVGDSRPMADLIPEEIGPDVYNMAIGGATSIETYYALRKMLQCGKPPLTVILSIAPSHMMTTEAYWSRTMPFGFLSFSEAQSVAAIARRDPQQKLYAISSLGIVDNTIANTLVENYFPAYFWPAMVRGSLFMNKGRNLAFYEETARARGHHLFGTRGNVELASPEAGLAAFRPLQTLDIYFVKTLDLLRDSGSSVVYIDMPISDITARGVSARFKAEYAAYIERRLKPYGNVRRVGEILPVLPASYFGDEAHLNATGALAWSRSVKPLLSERSQLAVDAVGLRDGLAGLRPPAKAGEHD